MSNVHQKSDNN